MPSTSRTGFALRREPTLRNRRAPANLQPRNHNDGQGAMRPDLILTPPRSTQNTQLPSQDPAPEEHRYGDFDFHDVEERNTDPTVLPPEMITQYAVRREKLSVAWKSIENLMTVTYFTCQYQTRNWTSGTKYLDPLEDCVCTTRRCRAVDLIYTHGKSIILNDSLAHSTNS
ncbi:hypothetical protein PGTUg99_008073 [Puccinia graminis f. sp. tritici]|uniref:Uncharacterized protein n=1 Tax=Puccinia graminis f. sp. tritici TaxID=56615 RepID=A0A5B0M2Z9_PUCGR|nr:hypothetical protein PGTUg99_008073 [Puccinia graminis f. sp. tritici]